MAVLHLPADLQAAIAAAARAGYPDEVCGLLLGQQAGGGVAVRALHPARNVFPERTADRFLLEPLDYLAAEQVAAAERLAVVGVWHSHPDHPPRPSATDREFAWPGWSYPIVSVTANGTTELRSWRLDGDAFSEEEVQP